MGLKSTCASSTLPSELQGPWLLAATSVFHFWEEGSGQQEREVFLLNYWCSHSPEKGMQICYITAFCPSRVMTSFFPKSNSPPPPQEKTSPPPCHWLQMVSDLLGCSSNRVHLHCAPHSAPGVQEASIFFLRVLLISPLGNLDVNSNVPTLLLPRGLLSTLQTA